MKRNLKFQSPKPRETPKARSPESKDAAGVSQRIWPDSFGEVWALNEGATAGRHPFDLEERTARFGEAVVRFSKKIQREPGNNRLIDQLVGCGTSGSAAAIIRRKNIASFASFVQRPMMFLKSFLETRSSAYREAKELMLIFAAIYGK